MNVLINQETFDLKLKCLLIYEIKEIKLYSLIIIIIFIII